MSHFLYLFTLAPVMKGLIAMAIAGASFPLCGVMVLRLDLIPLRYMLMHGVILGGALSLALSLPQLPVIVVVNVLLVLALLAITKDSAHGFGIGSAAAMVLSMALASIVMHKAGVAANDTLSLLWGSPYALTVFDIAALSVMAIVLILYIACNMRNILAIFYNQEVAQSLGIPVRGHYTFMVILIALTVALAMKIVGALLIDALLVLPVLVSLQWSAMRKKELGIKKLFIASGIIGFILAVSGFIVAVIWDLPPSGAISLIAGVLYFAFSFKELNK